MGTIADKLAYTSNAVSDIRTATKEKNPAFIEDCPLADVAQAIRDISGGGGSEFKWSKTLLGTYNSQATTTYTMKLSENARNFDLIAVMLYAGTEDYIKTNNNGIILYVGTPENLKNVAVNTYHASASSRTAIVFTLNLVDDNTLTLKKDQATSKTYYVYGIGKINRFSEELIAYYEADNKVDNDNQPYHRSNFPSNLVWEDGTIEYNPTTREFIVQMERYLMIWGLVGQVGGESNMVGTYDLYVNDVLVASASSYGNNEHPKLVYTGLFEAGDRIRIYNSARSWSTVASLMFYRLAELPQAATLNLEEE